MLALLLLAATFAPMAVEARLSARHERALRAAGASEPSGDVYSIMRVAYPACFLAMAAEAALRQPAVDSTFAAGLAAFVVGKGLKYWAMATLGARWTFRVLVPPESTLVTRGPYRLLRHPNYLGILGELVGMALMAHAPISGFLSLMGFGVLLAARIRVEDRALGAPLD